MWDVFKLALLSPGDYVGAIRKRKLILKDRIDEGNDIYSFVFEMEKPFAWRAGQHAIFRFVDEAVGGRSWRPFSIAAAPSEQIIRIGTIIKEEPSDFKAKLKALEPGGQLLLNGPFGEFYAKPEDKLIVGVAGGIGITPFRSLLHDLTNSQTDCKVELIYAARPGAHTYQSDFEQYQQQNNRIKVHYVSERKEVTAKLDQLVTKHQNQASYFISGAPRMIDGIRNSLLEKKIKRIVNDPFKGY